MKAEIGDKNYHYRNVLDDETREIGLIMTCDNQLISFLEREVEKIPNLDSEICSQRFFK